MMQLGDHPGVVLTEGAAPVDQDPQQRELLVVDHRPQPGHPGPDQGHGVRVGGVGLAALPGREDPGPRRQLRRNVDDLLTVSKESVGDVSTDPVAPFHRPDPVRPLPGVVQHRAVAVAVGAKASTAENRLVSRHHFDRRGTLVRVHAQHHSVHPLPPMLDPSPGCRAGRATLLPAEQTPLEPLPALGRRPELRRPNLSHTRTVGSRCESDSPGASTEAWPGIGHEAMEQVADVRTFSGSRKAGRGRTAGYRSHHRR